MQLRFHGIGGAFNPAMGNNGAFFTRDRDLFLLDCGEQAFSKVMQAELLTQYPGNITVIMTHLHADHCGSLGTLCLYAASIDRAITIVHPHQETIRSLLALMGARESQYTLVSSGMVGGIHVTPLQAQHVPVITAYSYFLQDEQEMIYYSGDNGELPTSVIRGIHTGELARAYVDVAWTRDPAIHPVHLPFHMLCQQVEPPLRSRFTLMHLNQDFRDEARQEGFACAEIDPIFIQP